jgi:hypothetical protein
MLQPLFDRMAAVVTAGRKKLFRRQRQRGYLDRKIEWMSAQKPTPEQHQI